MPRFTKAERKKVKLRLMVTGVSGSGKTYGALRIARGLGGRTAVIDTEHESSSLYANIFDFDSAPLHNHSPDDYIKAINDAVREGYDNVIIDSLTHMWVWCKDEADRLSIKSFGGNVWAAWSKVTPQYNALINCILQSDINIIVTVRSKSEHVVKQMPNGKTKIEKIGLKTEMKAEAEFEFTTVINIDHETNGATSDKDRTGIFSGNGIIAVDENIGVALNEWMAQGISPYIDDAQLQTLINMRNKITDQDALQKVHARLPDFSKIKASDYETVADELKVLIDWLDNRRLSAQTPITDEANPSVGQD